MDLATIIAQHMAQAQRPAMVRATPTPDRPPAGRVPAKPVGSMRPTGWTTRQINGEWVLVPTGWGKGREDPALRPRIEVVPVR